MSIWALILCSIFCCLVATRVSGTDFIVTSTADSGPGTLRKAIEDAAANGTAANDLIRFNISQAIFNQRIITLLSPLPALSSNLTIDGSTQPGQVFGNTDARICIKKDDYAAAFTLFSITNATSIKIYGIYMLYAYWRWEIERGDRSQQLYAVEITNSSDIEIGAPGKGNVINGYHTGVRSVSDFCNNIRIQSNLMGQGSYYENYTDDVDEVVLSVIAGIEMLNARDVRIGGPNPAQGNVIKANRAISLDSRNETGNGFIHIEHNTIGKFYDRTRILGGQDPNCPNIFIGENIPYLGASTRPSIDYEVRIRNNDIPTSLGLDKLSKHFVIASNKFDIPANSSLFTNQPAKLSITNCADGIIGGATDADLNSFRGGGVNGITAIAAYQNAAVVINRNVFECNMQQGTPTTISTDKTVVPFVRINTITAAAITGTATHNCAIEIFYDDDCMACEGKELMGRTTSDAAGNWSYTGTNRAVVATATTSTGTTGEFSVPETDISNVVVTHPGCGQNNGSITGLVVNGGTAYLWTDVNGNQISTSLDLLNVGPGRYVFYAKLGNTCMRFGAYYELVANTSRIADTTSKTIIQPSCGRNNGSINNIPVYSGSNSVIEWQNDRGQILQGAIDGIFLSLKNLYPGKYRLYIRDTITGLCNDSTFFYELTNTSGPAVDTNNVVIVPATCGHTNGSITNIAVRQLNGTPFLQWVDSVNNPVGNFIDLLNQPAGKYRLKFRDGSGCDTVYTPFFTIPQVDIFIDTSQVRVTVSGCNQDNGSITGLTAVGATGYRWRELRVGEIAGNNIDLFNVPPGIYQLTAFNNQGCNVQSRQYIIDRISAPVIDVTNLTIAPDTCQRGVGSITGTNVVDGGNGIQYRWLNATLQLVGQQRDLRNVPAGTYHLEVIDAHQCQVKSQIHTVTNISVQLPPPVYDNYTIPKGAPFTIRPKLSGRGIYKLYESQAGGIALQENASGEFELPPSGNDIIYYIEIQEGDCMSARVPVSIKMVDETRVSVPNAFSPNGDGLNDTWGISVAGIFKISYLKIFNRWGQPVFETRDPAFRWNGTQKGQPLPVGTYYWILQGTDHLGAPISQKGPVIIVR